MHEVRRDGYEGRQEKPLSDTKGCKLMSNLKALGIRILRILKDQPRDNASLKHPDLVRDLGKEVNTQDIRDAVKLLADRGYIEYEPLLGHEEYVIEINERGKVHLEEI